MRGQHQTQEIRTHDDLRRAMIALDGIAPRRFPASAPDMSEHPRGYIRKGSRCEQVVKCVTAKPSTREQVAEKVGCTVLQAFEALKGAKRAGWVAVDRETGLWSVVVK